MTYKTIFGLDHMTYEPIFQIHSPICSCTVRIVMCAECGREFDLLDESEADKWYSGHDCE